jgi:hypothetical protein
MTSLDSALGGPATKYLAPSIELSLLSIIVHVMPTMLCKVIKLLGAVVHRMVPLAFLQKLDKLAVYGAADKW